MKVFKSDEDILRLAREKKRIADEKFKEGQMLMARADNLAHEAQQLRLEAQALVQELWLSETDRLTMDATREQA